MSVGIDKSTALRQLQQWDAFLNGASCDAEEVLTVTNGKPTIPFGDVGRN